MLKVVLLATSMLVAAPAFAQDKPAPETKQSQPQTPPNSEAATTTDNAAPGTQGSGTVAEAPAATPAPATETAQPTPSQPAAPQPAPAQPATASAQPGTATPPAQPGTATPEASATGTTGAGAAAKVATQPAANRDQVAQAVTRDFGTYDKDANGALSDVEFGAWIGTLRKASQPAFAPGSAEANAWLGQAFAATDTDKSKSVNQAELTAFLTPKP